MIHDNSIVVSNGFGRFHVYRAALAAASAGLLQYFLTSFCVRNDTQAKILNAHLVRMLIGGRMVKKGMLRRYSPEISSSKIKSFILPEFCFKASCVSGALHRHVAAIAMRLFANMSALYTSNCRIFHVRSGFGLDALKQARRCGAVCVVDHSSAAPSFLKRVDHNLFDRWGKNNPDIRPYDSEKWSLVRQDVQAADIIVANSDFVKDTLVRDEQIDKEKIITIPMGVNTELFSPRIGLEDRQGTVNILYVGTISYRKGVHLLLEAYKTLSLPSAKLILVGKAGDALGLIDPHDETVQYIPHLPHPELAELYRSASMFVFPSLLEGSALVTYEAMASGLPIITTFEAGSVVREGQDGFIIPSNDVETLMDRMAYLYTNRVGAKEMGVEAKQNIIKNYTWQHYAARMNDLYRAILKQV